jgi:hypothetical protein
VEAWRRCCQGSSLPIKTHAVSVCYIHNDPEESSEHTIHTDGRLKELLSTKTKSLFVTPNGNSLDTVREILADPLVYGTDFMYTRRDNLKEQWTRSVATSVNESCAHCQKAPAPEKSLCVCSKCKSVAYCNRQCQRADWEQHKQQQCVDCHQLVAYSLKIPSCRCRIGPDDGSRRTGRYCMYMQTI